MKLKNNLVKEWQINYPKKPKKAFLVSNKIYNYNPVLPINMDEIKKEVENDFYCKLCSCMMLLFLIIGCVCLLVYN